MDTPDESSDATPDGRPLPPPPPPPPLPPPPAGSGGSGYGPPPDAAGYAAPGFPPPPPGWGPAGYPMGPPTTNGFAIAALVLGIVGFLCCVPWILALVFGYKARREIDASNGRQVGRGMATAGIVLGWVWAGLTAIYLIVLIAAGGTSSG